MLEGRTTWIVVLALFAYGSYTVAARAWADPAPFLLGGVTGLAIGVAWHCLEQLSWRKRESAYREYASHVAETVSLVYLKHAPCPACGRSPGDDEPANGFEAHAPSCPILGEITGFASGAGST